MDKPNEAIVDRAVELWKRMLRRPTYDHGDPSPTGGMAVMLAAMVPNNATEERLEAFGNALKTALMTPNEFGYCNASLRTDYGPDAVLEDAAEAAGLELEFPWKTSMSVHQDHISVRAGYAADTVHHYPLSGGRWLLARLEGKDMPKVIAAVEAGILTTLTIEGPAEAESM